MWLSHCLDLDLLDYYLLGQLSHIPKESSIVFILLLLVYYLHITEYNAFAGVAKPTYTCYSLEGFSGAIKALCYHQLQSCSLTSIVNTSHTELVYSKCYLVWGRIKVSQCCVVCVFVNNYNINACFCYLCLEFVRPIYKYRSILHNICNVPDLAFNGIHMICLVEL